jgi:hypothetical protein
MPNELNPRVLNVFGGNTLDMQLMMYFAPGPSKVVDEVDAQSVFRREDLFRSKASARYAASIPWHVRPRPASTDAPRLHCQQQLSLTHNQDQMAPIPPQHTPRIVIYYQTQHNPDGTPCSILPIITQPNISVTHVNVAAIHLNDPPGNITLVRDHLVSLPPEHETEFFAE